VEFIVGHCKRARRMTEQDAATIIITISYEQLIGWHLAKGKAPEKINSPFAIPKCQYGGKEWT
jgi:hypothetical protein